MAARVLVVDDEPVVLQVISRMLRREGYDVLEASGPAEALGIVKQTPPVDLVVSDICMPGMPGTELVREVARISPQTALMLVTGGTVDPDLLPDAVPVLRKPVSTVELITAVRAALAQSAKISADLARNREISEGLLQGNRQLMSECQVLVNQAVQVMENSSAARRRRREVDQLASVSGATAGAMLPPKVLTSREVEVLKLIADGRSSRDIAAQLGISFKTAVTHRSRIMDKLGVHDAVGLLRYAIRQKLIEP
jgi:DNA-binding NarL/FixJ family response regulator